VGELGCNRASLEARHRTAARLVVPVIVVASLLASGCAKEESTDCSPSFGGGISCATTESFDATQWAKDNWLLLVGLGAVALWIGDEALKRLSGQGDQTPPPALGGGAQPPRTPGSPRHALPAGTRQVIADNVRVGNRIVTDSGVRSVLSVPTSAACSCFAW